jgi:2-polyprenyl-3-methyl-5-hydroxy-6-metoxy-1,4-benzoquinol methylase
MTPTGKARMCALCPDCQSQSLGSGHAGSVASLRTLVGITFDSGSVMRQIAETLPDHGRPVPQEAWDRQYREGAWESLNSIDEFAHYMVIAGYVYYFFESPTILDVGCGQGRLAELLAPSSFKSYLGIDLSTEALKRARSLEQPHATFRLADLNVWKPPRQYSVIVFCESLNYAVHPVTTLLRYARRLKRNGAVIVSLYRHRNHGRIWKNAERHFETAHSTTVINPKGETWDVRLLRPLPIRTE